MRKMATDIELIPAQSIIDYSHVYTNGKLSREINELEKKLGVVNEEHLFANLVNPSASKSRPYYRWARYREGYSGDLVKELINRSNLNPAQHFVFDPMCGSGSTLIAASQLNFDCLGTDVNPYAIDVCNAKAGTYTAECLSVVEAFIQNTELPQMAHGLDTWKNMGNCQEYFKPQHFEVLQKIANAIGQIKDSLAQQLLFVIWLMVLEDCSEKMKDGNGLATRPSRVKDVWLHFVSRARIVLSDFHNHPLPGNVTICAKHTSAAKTASLIESFQEQTGKRLGTIIFSPPYANSFDYFESYKLELLCGYYDPKGLIEARKTAIRSYRKGYHYQLTTNDALVQMLCEEVKVRIPQKEEKTGKVDNRTRLVPNLLIGYFQDMEETLKTFFSYMPAKSTCHIVVDQSSYLGVIVPTDLILANIALRCGFEVAPLIRCRSAKSSVQQLKEYPYLKYMLRESILSLSKP